jgi:hypothetical protein
MSCGIVIDISKDDETLSLSEVVVPYLKYIHVNTHIILHLASKRTPNPPFSSFSFFPTSLFFPISEKNHDKTPILYFRLLSNSPNRPLATVVSYACNTLA